MTQTLKNAALIVLAAVAALGGLVIGARLADAGAERLVPAVVEQTEVTPQMSRIDAVPQVEGTERMDADQYRVAAEVADQVCEGAWAGVPVNEMAAHVAEIGGMSTEQAVTWIQDVIASNCTRTVPATP
jgi:hypothetical protein